MTTQFSSIYSSLISIWTSSGVVPAGYTGNTFAGSTDTAVNKLSAINSWVATSGATYRMVPGQQVLNACASADLAALTAIQLQQLGIITGATGGVDPTPGSNQASALAAIFNGKTTTLTTLGNLQTAVKITPTWWQQNGLPWAPTVYDAIAAGLVTGNPTMWTYQAQNKRRSVFNIVVDIQYTQVGSDGATLTGQSAIDAGFGSVNLVDSDVNLQALKRIVNVLLPGDAALAALTSS